MLKIVNDGISKEEFVSSFEAVLKQVLAVEEKIVANNKKAIEELRTLITSLGKELKSTSTAHFTEAKDVFLEQISKALQEQESGMKAIKGLLDEFQKVKEAKDVFLGQISKALQEQKNGMNFIYDKIRNLKNGSP